MVSHSDDKTLFYKLINRQRKSGQMKLSELVIDDVHLTETDLIRQGWAAYFKKLATPVDNEQFDKTV